MILLQSSGISFAKISPLLTVDQYSSAGFSLPINTEATCYFSIESLIINVDFIEGHCNLFEGIRILIEDRDNLRDLFY